MVIAHSDIEKVRQAADLIEIASQFTQLKKSGKNFVGRCPFHAERTPSFYINPELGLYYCFGCKASGDIFTFIQNTEHLTFQEAVKKVASQKGIQLHFEQSNKQEQNDKTQLTDLLTKAVSYYHETLKTSPEANSARSYLRSRGITKEVVSKFKLGYAPKSDKALRTNLKAPTDLLVKAGLGYISENKEYVSSFKDRIIFPIYDLSGKPIALGGRILPNTQSLAKYKNSKETILYQKRKVLYGLNLAKSFIVAENYAVVCEGYFDVIAMHMAGINVAVAPCGTALSEDHLLLLSRYCNTIVLAFDADTAGTKAIERLYEFQDAHELNLKVAQMPKGTDPADLYKTDPSLLKQIVQDSVELIDFMVDNSLKKFDLNTTYGKTKAINNALKIIAKYPNAIVQESKVDRLAQLLSIEPPVLKTQLKKISNTKSSKSGSEELLDEPRSKVNGPQFEALKIAIHKPETIANYLTAEVFTNEIALTIFKALLETTNLRDALEMVSKYNKEAENIFRQLLVTEPSSEAIDVASRVLQESAKEKLRNISAKLKVTKDQDGQQVQELVSYSKEIKLCLEKLRDSLEQEAAILNLIKLLKADI